METAEEVLKRLKSMVIGQNEKLQKALREYKENGDSEILEESIKSVLEVFDIWGLHP